ncbi:DsbA family oxidoreductase [Pragia fontium]|uniref:Predicted dithiol-disulfide isomerase, DsbA family n=2 Tax=Pragia fontium TaxID=82985 RepID=A0AAJ4W7S3_9GAMM|nr:DsbA family oxidoreductase [Pragia fontium]AKJ41356.1 DSBA oxidoreductase [Pragia fontium]SFC02886.1 Predicted dithiol-disulfide isomerase, DsbA family [Pragia fontium DSM 5563 = ATCC 49100]SUB81602.1 Protein-disulfide isomerase [Pragia fontium]VEJ54045.1 Protein-disulfide isomerase [Pragia fontium]GKX62911.1 DSBA oxidoreductase [Pragia fontium]
MKIQIWSDFSCPFCYIGKHHLNKAMASFAGKEGVEVVLRSFELDPDAPKQSQNNIYTNLSEKYDMSVQEAREMTQHISQQGKQAGLDFHFDTLVPTNTFDAHRLLHYAAEQGAMEAIGEMLFKALFTDSANLADRETLVNLAVQAGLDGSEVTNVLNSDRYADKVREDESLARQLKITSVPFFVFDNKYALSGAQPVSAFSEVLVKVQEEAQRLSEVESQHYGHGPSCSDGECKS